MILARNFWKSALALNTFLKNWLFRQARYFSLKSRDLKSYDIQTIHAIPGEFSEVMRMARNRTL